MPVNINGVGFEEILGLRQRVSQQETEFLSEQIRRAQEREGGVRFSFKTHLDYKYDDIARVFTD